MGNQAEEKAESGEAGRKNRSTGKATERQGQEEGNGRNRRLSSQNRKRRDRKGTGRKGKARRREHKGSTGGTAVGAKPGGMKGNKQRAEYEEPGKKTWEIRSERTGKSQRSESREGAPGKPL